MVEKFPFPHRWSPWNFRENNSRQGFSFWPIPMTDAQTLLYKVLSSCTSIFKPSSHRTSSFFSPNNQSNKVLLSWACCQIIYYNVRSHLSFLSQLLSEAPRLSMVCLPPLQGSHKANFIQLYLSSPEFSDGKAWIYSKQVDSKLLKKTTTA